MTNIRIRLATATAWAMIPLAAWAGMPGVACLCANGRVKLFCTGDSGMAEPEEHRAAVRRTSSCCGASEQAGLDARGADCCGGGLCPYGTKPLKAGFGAKACCTLILAAPILAPKPLSQPCDEAPTSAVVALEFDTLSYPSFIADLAGINTGPPLDRVIVFRSLLI